MLISRLLPTHTINSADSLEEVVGLDIGYTGGFRKHRNSMGGGDELEDKMEEYLQEYEHRKREKAYFKKVNANNRRLDGSGGSGGGGGLNGLRGAIPASSIHDTSLHGTSYHGKKIITTNMIESLDTTSEQNISGSNSNHNDTVENGHNNQERAV